MIIEMLLESGPGQRAVMRSLREDLELVAPDLLILEIISGLRKLRLRKAISSLEARQAFQLFKTYEIEFYSHEPLAERVWQLQHNITPYDASYVALAESLHAPLWTSDRRLAQACDGIIAAEFFGDLTQTA